MDATLVASGSQAASSVWLTWMWRAVVFGTTLAGLTYLLTRLPRLRIGPAVEAALWSVVLIKFLIPVGPAWSFSLSSVYHHLFAAGRFSAAASTGLERIKANDWDPASLEVRGRDQAAIHPFALDPPATATPTPPGHPLIAGTGASGRSWTVPLGACYLVVVVVLFVMRIRSYALLHTGCAFMPPAERPTRNLVLDVCRRLGVRRLPLIRISDETPAPFVMGFVRPLIVLPRRLLVRPDELETVVVHEVAHLRRGDMFVRYLQWVAGTLMFFWPVVAWVNRRLDVARECACDEWALRQGKLTAQEYARCLLRVVQPGRSWRLSYHPCSMATNQKTIERRIDMILASPRRPANRRVWGLLTAGFILAWGGFALTGAAVDGHDTAAEKAWPTTDQAVQERAAELYGIVAERKTADFDHDGVLSYLERDTYLVALAMDNAEAFMEEFPYADRNHSGSLDILEAKGVIRAVTLIAYADRRACAATEQMLPLEFCHAALEAQKWLLDHMTSEPSTEALDNIWSILKRVEDRPGSYSARMFDYGGPDPADNGDKCLREGRSRFQELENIIAVLESCLATTRDLGETAKLRLMLTKLEALLGKLKD